MARKKRSELFAEKNQIKRPEKKQYRENKVKTPKKQARRKRNKKKNLLKLLIFILIILFPLFIYQKFINTPQRTINKAVSAIKDLDYEKQKNISTN